MRVAVVAGPDPGHAFPAAGLALRLHAAGHEPTVYTGRRWLPRLRVDGLRAVELPGVRAAADDPDTDWGYRLHGRAAAAAPAVADLLRAHRAELVVADTLTAAGGLAAELVGLPWLELVPHLLQIASVALPPPGTGLAPGRTPVGRTRDALLRRLHQRSVEQGRRQRAAARLSIGLPAADAGPAYRLVATLPALEPDRPDWPARTAVIGPLHWEPADGDLRPPPGDGPLIVVSPPTATSGRTGVVDAVLAAVAEIRSSLMTEVRSGPRLAATLLTPAPSTPAAPWAAIGPGRQAPLLAAASVVVAGGGHGMVSKALAAGVPLVLLPGGGDQRDLSRRVARLGAGTVIERAATPRRLAAAIRRVLTDPGYAAAACAAAGSAPRAVDPVRLCAQAATDRAEGQW